MHLSNEFDTTVRDTIIIELKLNCHPQCLEERTTYREDC